MPWPKPSAEKTEHLERALSGRGDRRVLFGAPTWFVGGNMFTGVFGDDVFLRLTPADLVEKKSLGARSFEPMKGGAMKEYATLPPVVMRDEKPLAHWLDRSYSYAASMPAKVKKK